MFRFAGYVAVQIAGLLALAACTSDPTAAAGSGGAGAGGSVANVAGSQSISAAGVASPSSAGVGGAAAPAAPSGGAGASGARSMAGSVAAGQGGGSAGTAAAGAPAAGAPAAGGGGTGGAVAEPSGFRCPNGPFGAPLPASVSVARVDGLPPADAFNDSGRTRTNIEGAVWIRDTLYVAEFPFTPAPGSRVLALGPDNQVSVALASAGANGMAVDAMGNLILTDHG
ncbi:MAG TPA: hypothetical protein VJR89_19320, partial [Polyangiales bacterium]|nr:hypothetical protein [Polyangiales bacterium]